MVSYTSRRNVFRGGFCTAAAATDTLPGPIVEAVDIELDSLEPVPASRVGWGDARHLSLAARGRNRRFEGRPDHVWVAGRTSDVVRAVQDAVHTGRRLAVRSGGHCYEGLVADPDVRVVIDMSAMTAVYWDAARRAHAVEAGATLGEAYRKLYLGWGVTVPAGRCTSVGAGGHFVGGGSGPLSRTLGLSVDHLYAVETVVVDGSGRARPVIATRDPEDPNRDLWWAHTGGGGGTFGVVTRYWFRDLPTPPAAALTFDVHWPWTGLDQDAFVRMLSNHGRWIERNSTPGMPSNRLYSELRLTRPQTGRITLHGQVASASRGYAENLLHDHVTAISANLPVRPVVTTRFEPWLTSALQDTPAMPSRLKAKSAYLRRRFTQSQSQALYRSLTRADYDHPGGSLSLYTSGGTGNAVAPDATAVPHRAAVMQLFLANAWDGPEDEPRHLAWTRETYRDLFAETGGVPPDGAAINYADTDLADPAWNQHTPWQRLYFGANYPRLQRVKARWDPLNVFHHALSVRR
ncbi:FAD-binding oxidoreductase [Actinomadura rupiterrae]|uniref:FAD-binding oxidoreductase n=1 Tax=Actinomadura rupiterrae TaxID=559627 RepID=UPI0020A2BE76|nr:BBE domain-containing protein [Actinomadura rupiterrae]MCP2343055.1 FAD/FMN-containing dehydrogenase [Actinomadura rupiterrae]